MKLGSLAASIILYGYIQYTRNIKRTLHVKVERPQLEKGLMYASEIPSFLDVEMSGSKEINNFESHEFKVHLRLSNPPPKPGKENLFRVMLNPGLPKGIKVAYKDQLTVLLDRIIVREFPIIPQIQAALAQGQKIGYVKVEPPTVKLVGPEQVLRDMDQIGTKSVNILNETIIQNETQLSNLPQFVSLAKDEGEIVKVSIVVLNKNKDNFKTITGIPLKCSNPIPGLKLQILGSETVDITIKTDDTNINQNEFQAEIFCPVYYDHRAKQIQPGFHITNKPVMVRDLKNRLNIDIMKVQPAIVSLQFEKIENKALINDTRQQGFKEHILIQP